MAVSINCSVYEQMNIIDRNTLRIILDFLTPRDFMFVRTVSPYIYSMKCNATEQCNIWNAYRKIVVPIGKTIFYGVDSPKLYETDLSNIEDFNQIDLPPANEMFIIHTNNIYMGPATGNSQSIISISVNQHSVWCSDLIKRDIHSITLEGTFSDLFYLSISVHCDCFNIPELIGQGPITLDKLYFNVFKTLNVYLPANEEHRIIIDGFDGKILILSAAPKIWKYDEICIAAVPTCFMHSESRFFFISDEKEYNISIETDIKNLDYTWKVHSTQPRPPYISNITFLQPGAFVSLYNEQYYENTIFFTIVKYSGFIFF